MANYALPRGTLVDVRGQNAILADDWRISHTILIVYSEPEGLVAYKDASKPIRWKKMNPLRVLPAREVSWLVDASYWIPVGHRRMGYLQVAYVHEELLWWPGPGYERSVP